MKKYDIAIVGAGIIGLGYALAALKKGLSVVVMDKDSSPTGSSVQNFGMVITGIMTDDALWHQYALLSNRIYKEINEVFDLGVRNHGSLYLADTDLQNRVLKEFKDYSSDNNINATYFDNQMLEQRYPFIDIEFVKSGLLLADDLNVDPLNLIPRLIAYLAHSYQRFSFKSNSLVQSIEENGGCVEVKDSNGNNISASKTIVCSGFYLNNLFPDILKELQVCKLHMLKLFKYGQPILTHNIMSGMSVRRYLGFGVCPSYKDLQQEDVYDLDKDGIHLLFKQEEDGSIIIGDSHHYYSSESEEGIQSKIDMDIINKIVFYGKKILKLNHWEVSHYWLGKYVQTTNGSQILRKQVNKNTHLVTGIGGKGMTTALGYAQETIESILRD